MPQILRSVSRGIQHSRKLTRQWLAKACRETIRRMPGALEQLESRQMLSVSSPWLEQDIGWPGNPGQAGSADQNGTTFEVRGGGEDIWNEHDHFHFVYQPMTGDGEIVAQVTRLDDGDGWIKAGVMMRAGLELDDPHMSMDVTNSNGATVQWRELKGQRSFDETPDPDTEREGTWVKVVRQGNTFTNFITSGAEEDVAWIWYEGADTSPTYEVTADRITLRSTDGSGVQSENSFFFADYTAENFNYTDDLMSDIASVPGWVTIPWNSFEAPFVLSPTAGQVPVEGSGAAAMLKISTLQPWQQQGASYTVVMPNTVYVGLVLTSHNNGELKSATFSNVAMTTTPEMRPQAPSRLVALGAAPGAVQVRFQDNSSNEDRFVLERSTTDTFDPAQTTTILLEADEAKTLDENLTGGTAMYYRAKAVSDELGDSGWSNVYKAVVPTELTGLMTLDLEEISGSVNLTAEGKADWAHWGLADGSIFNHRAGVVQKISDVTMLGTDWKARDADNAFTAFSWTNGINENNVATTATNTRSFVWNNVGNDVGFQLTAPADEFERTLTLYVASGQWGGAAEGRLVAELSDGTALPVEDIWGAPMWQRRSAKFTITYKASTPGQTLTLRWTRERDNVNQGNWSSILLQAATLVGGPAEPASGLTATAGGSGAAFLSWDEGANGASYNIFRSQTDGGPYELVASNVAGTEYMDMGLTNGETYYYVVRTVGTEGDEAGDSNQASVVPQLTEPRAPANVWGRRQNGQNIIEWSPSPFADTYTVKRATASGAEVPLPNATNITGTKFVDENAPYGGIYYYVVSASNVIGESLTNSKEIVIGTGVGLMGTYYKADGPAQNSQPADYNFDVAPTIQRLDAMINFPWGDSAPDSRVGADQFSVRWEGMIQAPYTGRYTFYPTSDDGERLFLNGAVIAEGWSGRGDTEDTSQTVDLVAGQMYPIKQEYYDSGGGGNMYLRWQAVDANGVEIIAKDLIPSTALFPAKTNAAPTLNGTQANLTAARNGDYHIKLTWNDFTESEVGYSVYRSASPNGPWVEMARLVPELNGPAPSFYNDPVSPDSHYYYKVGAFTTSEVFSNVAEGFTNANTPNNGTGLWGTYYEGLIDLGRSVSQVEINKADLRGSRLDAKVDFNFGGNAESPWPGVVPAGNDWGVVWTGRLLAEYSEPYTFYTASDDGTRLWINDVLVVDNWYWQGENERAGRTIQLESGQLYNIRMEYFQGGGGEQARLRWSSPSQPKEIIPTRDLFPPAVPAAPQDLSGGVGATSGYFTWNDVGITEYKSELQASTDGGETWSTLTTLRQVDNPGGMAQVGASVNGLIPGTSYLFRVLASSGSGSVSSNLVELTTPALVAIPTTVEASAGATDLTSSANLDWARWGVDFSGDLAASFRHRGPTGISDVSIIGSASPALAQVAGQSFAFSDNYAAHGDDVIGVGQWVDPSSWNLPWGERAQMVTDNDPATKYLNFDKLNTGFTVWLPQQEVVTAIGLTSANDAEERDPASYLIEGWTDAGRWEYVASGNIPNFSGRAVKQEFAFANNKACWGYRVTFPTVRDAARANSMQIAEVELYRSGATSVDNDHALALSGAGNGFSFTVPVGTSSRQLKVYVAVADNSSGTLTATLSDGSVLPLTDATLSSNGEGTKSAVYTLDLTAGKAGQTLTVQWVAQSGTVMLQAATLSETSAPAAPAALRATAVLNRSLSLAWDDRSDNERFFVVQRSTDGVNWQTLASLKPNTTSYTDSSGLEPGQAYSYRVLASGQLGDSQPSEVLTVTTVGYPDGWYATDVGGPGAQGQVTYSNDPLYGPAGVWSVRASGHDVWDKWDGGHFVYQPLYGDAEITARVLFQQDTDWWAKAGLMIREAPTDDARHAIAARVAGRGFVFQGREHTADWSFGNYEGDLTDGSDWWNRYGGPDWAPKINWLRLKRVNNTITAFASIDGSNWVQMGGERTLAMNTDGPVYVGMFVTAHNNDGRLNRTDFDSFTINYLSDPVGTPAAPAISSVTAESWGDLRVDWQDASSNETGFLIERAESADGPWTLVGRAAPNATSFWDDTASVGGTYFYRVLATNARSASPTSEASASASAAANARPSVVYANFTGATGLAFKNVAAIAGDRLRITDAYNDQKGQAWINQRLDASRFAVSFDFQMSLANGADGFAFVIQNDWDGVNADGEGGGNMGWGGWWPFTRNTVALKFDIYPNNDQTGLYYNGRINDSGIDLRPFGIDLDGDGGVDDGSREFTGEVFRVTVVYDGKTLTQMIAKAADPANILFTQNYTVDIPRILGRHDGLFGFTGANGGLHSRNDILNFSYDAITPQAVELNGGDQADVVYLKREGAVVNVWTNDQASGAPAQSLPYLGIASLSANGGLGADRLIIDLSGGNPLPASGLAFTGMADTLVVKGASLDALFGTASDLNLADNTLILQVPAGEDVSAALAKVEALVASGKLQAAGMTSGGLAAVLNRRSGAIALHSAFGGQTVDANSILVKYTFSGDANLDGKVDADDYFRINRGQAKQASGYVNGDFNYDQVIDLADYSLIDRSFLGTKGAAGGQQAFSATAIAPKAANKASAAKKLIKQAKVAKKVKVAKAAKIAKRAI